jgi:hypothetical protein
VRHTAIEEAFNKYWVSTVERKTTPSWKYQPMTRMRLRGPCVWCLVGLSRLWSAESYMMCFKFHWLCGDVECREVDLQKTEKIP